jgi:protein-tyrosine-phosphatase
MVQIAHNYQIDMKNHKSSTINKTMIDQADIIFTMEIEQITKLTKQYPKAKTKTFLLSSLVTDQKIPLEISDPYGKNKQDYENCFKQIQTCVSTIPGLTAKTKN